MYQEASIDYSSHHMNHDSRALMSICSFPKATPKLLQSVKDSCYRHSRSFINGPKMIKPEPRNPKEIKPRKGSEDFSCDGSYNMKDQLHGRNRSDLSEQCKHNRQQELLIWKQRINNPQASFEASGDNSLMYSSDSQSWSLELNRISSD